MGNRIIKYRYLEDVNLRYIFYIFSFLWAIDLISTFIALNFFNNFYEANPFQAFFFNLGWYGWFISIFLTFSILFLLSVFIGFCARPIKKIEDKKKVKGYYNIFIFYCAGILSGMEILVLVNNIFLLLGRL
jgi:hypothetical protein